MEHQTVKTFIKDIDGTQELIVNELLVKSKKWFSKVTKAIDKELQKMWASITLIGKSQVLKAGLHYSGEENCLVAMMHFCNSFV